MTNIYVFWKLVADPPAPWTRLTRTNKYTRFSSNPANHMNSVGSTTRTGSMSSVAIGDGSSQKLESPGGGTGMARHTHTAPASWTISSANNNPLYYGLDIIYMDLATWESSQRCFPEGSILVSNGALIESSELERFTAADGKYICNTTPETLGGSDTPQSQNCQGTTGSETPIQYNLFNSGGAGMGLSYNPHNHTINLSTAAAYLEPKRLVTRLYEALMQTSLAQAETVVFVDGTPSDKWEILSAWDGSNLKAGNSNPTLSGNDSPTQTISGNTSDHTAPSQIYRYTSQYATTYVTLAVHNHPVTADLIASVVPSSIQLIPVRLLVTMYSSRASHSAQLIGPIW